MKKFTFLFILAIGFTSCSVESMDSTENLLVIDAKAPKALVVTSVDYDETVCFGDEANFTFNFPQAYNANNKEQKTLVILELWNEVSEEWIEIHQANYDGAGPQNFSYDFGAEGTYLLQHRIGTGNNWTAISVTVEDCNPCDESFSYVDNGNGTYTFTYIAGEDMKADLVFTFAQGSYVSGLSADFSQNGNGQTYEATMYLEKCDILQYIVTLSPNCSGQSKTSNVWTDFKVNDISQKADINDKFTASCN